MHRLTCPRITPFCRSRRRVRFWCDVRVLRFARCVSTISVATCSSSRVETRPFSHSELIWAAIALWIWHTVHSGFFPPTPQNRSGEKKIADTCQDQMSDQPLVGSALVMVQAQFALLILKAALHAMPSQRHQQQRCDRRARRRVADEVLHVSFAQHVPGHDQVQLRARQTVFVLGPQQRMLDFPDARTLFAIIQPILLPWLITQFGTACQQLVQPAWLGCPSLQTRPVLTAVGPRRHLQFFEPTDHVLGNLGHIALVALRQFPQKIRLAAVILICCMSSTRTAGTWAVT